MSMKLVTYRLGDFLKRNRSGINLQDHISYKRATIKINNKGITIRDELRGESIKTKRQFLISQGQFLMSKIDARNGAFGIVPSELDNGIITGNFWTFDVDERIVLADFFKNFTLAPYFIEICQKASSGSTNRKYLNESKFLNIAISIPPISEQELILKKLDIIKAHHSLLKIEFEKQENLLVKLRQSILIDLIQGRLTKEWREKNQSIEPASELLKRVRKNKEELIRKKKIKREKVVSSIRKEEVPFEIPKSWEWCRIQDIAEKLGAGSTPKGGNSVYVSQGIMFLRSQNIYNEGLKLDNIAFITDEIHEKMKGTKVLPKDILLNITGGSIGRCTLIDENFGTANVSQHVAIVRMIELETRQFIHKLIISPYFQDRIMDVQVGVSREGLSMTSLKTLLVPLPPIEEQKEIIGKAEYLFSNCDNLEQEIKLNKENTDKIIQAILSDLLGIKNISPIDDTTSLDKIKQIASREVKYNSKTVNMKLIELLKLHDRLHAKDLWKMSEHYNKINESESLDKFYAELKKQIEEENTIKESTEKGYLELA
jgi:type I restriction enzyme S subunit